MNNSSKIQVIEVAVIAYTQRASLLLTLLIAKLSLLLFKVLAGYC